MKLHTSLLPFLALLLFLFTGIACYYDVEEELYPETNACDTTAVSYTADILPLIQSACYSCHNIPTSFGSVTLEPYTALKEYVDNGQLSCTINHANGCSPMPTNAPKMPDCEISLIEKWIADGAPEN